MAYQLQHEKNRLPRRAASQVNEGAPVRSSASQVDYVVPVGSYNLPVQGVAVATAASPGDGVAIQTEGVVVCRAAASVGHGAVVAVGSTNGRLIPVGAAPSAPIPQGINTVGESVTAAADGEYFSVLLKPRQAVV